MEVSTWISVISLITGLYLLFARRKGRSSKLNLPPCVPSLPIVGSLPFFPKAECLAASFMKLSEKYGNVFSFYTSNTYTVVLNGYEVHREALLKHAVDFAGRFQFYGDQFMNPDRRGIINKQWGEGFRRNHKIVLNILRQFGFGDKRVMESQICDEATHLLKYFKDLHGKEVFPLDVLSQAAVNNIFSLVFGERAPYEDKESQHWIELNNRIIDTWNPLLYNFPALSYFPPFRAICKEIPRVTREVDELFKQRIRRCLQDKSENETFVKRYFELSGESYDESELVYILRDLAIGGTETTSITLAWLIVYLGNHPHIMKRCQDEIDSLGLAGRLPSLDDISSLAYTEATVLEIMRLRTAIATNPHTTTCDTELMDFNIPANTLVMANFWSMHMDAQVWTDPEKFRPERFLDSQGNVTNRDLMVAFSFGKRACIGETLARQQLFLTAAALIQHFNFLPPHNSSSIRNEMEVKQTIHPARYEVRLVERNPTQV